MVGDTGLEPVTSAMSIREMGFLWVVEIGAFIVFFLGKWVFMGVWLM